MAQAKEGAADKGQAAVTPEGPASAVGAVSREEFAQLSSRVDKLLDLLSENLRGGPAPAAVSNGQPVTLQVVKPDRFDVVRKAQAELDRRNAVRDRDVASSELEVSAGPVKWIVAVVVEKERGRLDVINPPMICGGDNVAVAEAKFRHFHGILSVSMPSRMFVARMDDAKNPIPSDLLDRATKAHLSAQQRLREASDVLERMGQVA
jgi:hypothetical protein